MKEPRVGVRDAGPGSLAPCVPTTDRSPAWHRLHRFAELRSVSRRLVGQASTRTGKEDAAPLDLAVGREAVRQYEVALARLRPRDREAVLGRIELHWPYEQLAEALGVATAPVARAVVIRAIGRLVEAIEPMKLAGNLQSLVASVADGWPQDWTALEARADDELTRHGLKNLRVITAIADFHRSGRSVKPPPGDGHSSTPTDGQLVVELRPVVKQWGRFLLRRKLGEGAFGDVYSAYDPQLDREVALKLLKPVCSSSDQDRRLLGEARMLAQVRHPNVASVFGADLYDGRAGLWMELISGLTLEQQLRSRGPLSACEAALVGQDVCRALTAVHRAGLVHRDVKTANVIREVGGRIVLTDFGAGRFRAGEPKRELVGTPHYVAPEVVAGAEATQLSDIYSLGVLLYRLVTGAYPRPSTGWDDLLEIDPLGSPPSLRDLRSDLSETFVSVVEQALSSDPSERPQSAGALCAVLGLVLGPASWRKAGRASSHHPPKGS
jgi:Protein kinase domain